MADLPFRRDTLLSDVESARRLWEAADGLGPVLNRTTVPLPVGALPFLAVIWGARTRDEIRAALAELPETHEPPTGNGSIDFGRGYTQAIKDALEVAL